MTTTATVAMSKAIVTSKLMADGTMKTVASKLITNRLAAARSDCTSLRKVGELAEKAMAAENAIAALLLECSE